MADRATPTTAARRPLRRDAQRNRERIVEAARGVFGAGGLSATVDEVARRAGVGVGTIYRRFPDKEQLIDAVFEERVQALTAMAQDSLRFEDPWSGFVDFLERASEAHAADRGLREVALCLAHGRERIEQARHALGPLVARLVERAQADGSMRPDIEATDLQLILCMLGVLSGPTCHVDGEDRRRFLRIMADGLRTRRDGPSAPGCVASRRAPTHMEPAGLEPATSCLQSTPET